MRIHNPNIEKLESTGSRKFLTRIPQEVRGRITDKLLKPIRQGEHNPGEVVGIVEHRLNPLRDGVLVDALVEFRTEAIQFVEYLLTWEMLTGQEKAHARKRRYFSRLPVSDRQKELITQFGIADQFPDNYYEANQMITLTIRSMRDSGRYAV